MTSQDIASCWANRFGLALNPLFDRSEVDLSGSHNVLLDGGYSSFVLSETEESIWKDRKVANWSWSSNIPHHVIVTGEEVAVIRWDKRKPELLTRKSVEREIEHFYGYLTTDRVKSRQRVVEHMITIFRRVRSLVADSGIKDERSIDAYLAFLGQAIARSSMAGDLNQSGRLTHPEGEEVLRTLSSSVVETLFEDVTTRLSSELQLALIPSLAVRHAGSEIFQEAHFELLQAPQPDLFGHIGPAESNPITRGGAHFTPPALARSVAEQTLRHLPNLAKRERLVIFDPACGSGAFLHEALRTLRRIDFCGQLTIVGRDTSQPAVSMAKFALNHAHRDWSPAGGCEIDIQQGDSLLAMPPKADVVLMNPPFVAWPALNSKQRQQMQDVLGKRLKGRGDLSMAFVTRALESLASGGVLGTLLPGSLLTLQAASDWREDLLDQAELRFIASLGDFGLFTYAHVQVAALVFEKSKSDQDMQGATAVLVPANDPEATGNALRTLRRNNTLPSEPSSDNLWHLFQTSGEKLRRRANWRLIPPKTEKMLSSLMDTGNTVPIGNIFDVRQGVRTGLNSAFLLTTNQLEELPRKERKWFQPAIINESIKGGRVSSRHRVFYPYDKSGLVIASEADLAKLLPVYFERYLKPKRSQLEKRAPVARLSREGWWGLSARRAWALDTTPRLVSKYFGGPGGFATDFEARYIVVQGFAWFPKWVLPAEDVEKEAILEELPLEDVLAAYLVVMNSSPFGRLLEIFSPHVAGGQFDLSARYVNSIPIPHLSALSADEQTGWLIARLSDLGNNPQFSDTDWRATADRLTTELYGDDIFSLI